MSDVDAAAEPRSWRFAAICFEHPHVIHYVRYAHAHPRVKVVGVWGESQAWIENRRAAFDLPDDPVFSDWEALIEREQPDIVALAPAHSDHRLWVERTLERGAHVILSKPFATNLEDADAMMAAADRAKRKLLINWPLRWYPPHVTAKRLLDEGRIGRLLQVHFHDGNRGPGRDENGEPITDPTRLRDDFFYRQDRGGGSLIDYLGYGSTLATWFFDGAKPTEIQCMTSTPENFEVDHHSITTVRYPTGLSKFETRWGLLSDPWVHQPQPKCGFILVGEKGSISSYDHENHITLQTHEHPEGIAVPADVLNPPLQDPVQYLIHCLETGSPIEGPLDPKISRIGQQIVDTAIGSSRAGCTLPFTE